MTKGQNLRHKIQITGGIHSILLSNDGTFEVQKNIITEKCKSLDGPFLNQINAFNNKLYFVEVNTNAIWSFDSESCLREGAIPLLKG